jgi:hypothetical protein
MVRQRRGFTPERSSVGKGEVEILTFMVRQRRGFAPRILTKTQAHVFMCASLLSLLLWADAPEAALRKPLRPPNNEKNVGHDSPLAGPIQTFY